MRILFRRSGFKVVVMGAVLLLRLVSAQARSAEYCWGRGGGDVVPGRSTDAWV